ncbi:uncharacterized protein A4U43_C05F29470 [Asparagus officinalis]|uniref:Aminotransferase-like plant mobile domain-containing protein n=1 Tax=Asparagus officinalis TaxID=4686 RepID=A0A5P1EVH2_ASPOF|nr:uncharacterized protein A4U43_C05F29470 [Asparagus officinalis]
MIDGYNDWCLYLLQKYTDALERLNIYGAILSSLGVYHIDFQLLQSFLECWDKDRNVFATKWGDLSISLLDIERIGGLPIQGQVYDEYVPTNEELEDPEVKHGQPLKALLNYYQYLRRIDKHFIIPSDGRMGKTLNGYVIWYQEGYHNFFAEESSPLSEDSAESTQIIKRKCSFVDDPKKKQQISSDLVLKATSISPVRNKSVCANDMIVNLEGDDDHTLPASIEIQRSPSLHKKVMMITLYPLQLKFKGLHHYTRYMIKIHPLSRTLIIFKDYREPASSGNSSDEDETQPRTNDNLSNHEDISKQNTSIQQDQIIVPQMSSGASGSFSSVEQAIQVFFEECKDQVLCNVSSSAKVQPFMPGIYHIKSKDEILEL